MNISPKELLFHLLDLTNLSSYILPSSCVKSLPLRILPVFSKEHVNVCGKRAITVKNT
jgi:hypothetical protein